MNDMLPVIIPVILSSLSALAVAFFTYRSNRKDILRQEKVDTITAYSQLLDDMRAAMELNNREIARLRQELQDIRCRLDTERAAWDEERKQLLSRISDLECINAKLEAKIAELEREIKNEE